MEIRPVTLEGSFVRLEPLSLDHLPGLCEAGLEPALWEFTLSAVRTPDEMRRYVEEALAWQRQGTALPFAIVERVTGTVIGSTRFANIDGRHRRAEIGWTWVSGRWQRTAVNTETKLLLLSHAFETLGCNRVEFKTDSLNRRSREAIARIGGKEEGLFRNHMVTASGRIRHTVYFSVIAEEWADVKKNLMEKLQP
jgi:RimJ/RimL family protein N-acetyltransferase